jgi:hypothetical protein
MSVTTVARDTTHAQVAAIVSQTSQSSVASHGLRRDGIARPAGMAAFIGSA